MSINPTTITTGEVRLSYLHLLQPYAQQQNAEPKYSATILVPKSDVATKSAIDGAIRAAIDAGVGKCWNGVRPPQPAISVQDGDGTRPTDGLPYSPECKGHWVVTASSKIAPFVVDANLQPILQQGEVYSGMYGRVNLTFFPYFNSGKKGVGCGLNGVQKLRDGEPLGARVSIEDAFGAPGMPAAAAPVNTYQQPAAPTGYPQAAPAYTATPAGYPQQAPAYGTMPTGYTQVDPITGQPTV